MEIPLRARPRLLDANLPTAPEEGPPSCVAAWRRPLRGPQDEYPLCDVGSEEPARRSGETNMRFLVSYVSLQCALNLQQ